MLRLDRISKSYSFPLFEDVSFTVGNKEKIGLVGLNGCGKTTLFKIISGKEEPDRGSVILEDEAIALLPQEFDMSGEELVGEYLESLVPDQKTEMYLVKIILSKLGIADIDEYEPLNQLSEGQKMKLYLTKLLMGKQIERKSRNVVITPSNLSQHPPILLLDEPTNHLDIEGILWLESFLENYDGIVFCISHDRAFLNSVCTHIFEIDEQTIHQYTGNYDDYLEQKAERIEFRRQQFMRQERKRKQLENLISSARKISDGTKRGNAVEAAKKRLIREVLRNEIQLYTKKQIKEFSIAGSVHASKKMLSVKELSFSYPGTSKEIIKDSSQILFGGEKFWIYGPNGSGKTTFIKLLIGQLAGYRGSITWGPNVRFAYFSQNQAHLPRDEKVAAYFMKQTGIPFENSFGALNKFLFDKEQRDTVIGMLSPGQRARLSFAIFAQQNYDFLILDEPTNHLDIETKELIELALAEFAGNILLISHDRYFVKNVGPTRAGHFVEGVFVEE